jgi:hypothetical protein
VAFGDFEVSRVFGRALVVAWLVLCVATSDCSSGESRTSGATAGPTRQQSSQATGVATPTARDERWRQDLQYLARELVARHPNAFFSTTKDTFDKAVADLDARIPTLRDDQVITGFARLVALLGDGHTVLPVLQKGTNFKVFPLAVAWFPDGLYVVAAPQSHRDALGKRVLKIGQMTPEQALAAVTPLVSHENNQWLLAQSPGYLVTAEVLHDTGVEPDAQRAQFLLESGGSQSVLELSAVEPSNVGQLVSTPLDALPLYRRQPAKDYWFEYLPEQKTAYVQYNKAADDPTLPFATFAAQVFAYIDSHPTTRFVLDLRNNGGGNSQVIQPLISGLAARPGLSAKGHLFVIVSRNTFSSGLLAATDLRKVASPLIFGEPTGGKPNSYGEVLTFSLPNSGLTVTYSKKYFKTQEQDTSSLLPDVTITVSAADFFAGRDPVLDAALAYEAQ